MELLKIIGLAIGGAALLAILLTVIISSQKAKEKVLAENNKKQEAATTTETTKTKSVKKEKVVKPVVEEKAVKEEIVEEKETEDINEEPKSKKVVNIYHVSQNKDEKSPHFKKWRIRKQGSTKTIIYFKTQKEAIAHAKELAESTNGSVRVHKVTGEIRKA